MSFLPTALSKSIVASLTLSLLSLSSSMWSTASTQTPQINIPEGFEIVEPTKIETIQMPDGRIIHRQVPPVLRRIETPPPEPDGPPDGWIETPVAFSTAGLGAVWYEPIIQVCWESADPASAQGRVWTREAVEASWEDVSQVDFAGWRTCTETDRGIRIGVGSNGPHVTALGRQIDGVPNGMMLNFTFESWGTGCASHLEYCIKALAVHEFGHALGLAHEHNREDRNLCETEPQGPLPAFLMTTYDPSSVMNYCSADWNNNGRLSPLDVAGIRLLYGPYADETPATVELVGAMTLSDAAHAPLGQLDIDAQFALTQTEPSQSKSFTGCLDETLWAEATVTASIGPGESTVNLHSIQKMFETTDCRPSATLTMEAEDTYTLVEPGKRALAGTGGFQEFRDGVRARRARMSFSATRSVGDTTQLVDCESCVAASENAMFASGAAPFGLSGSALHGTSEIASPWPDNFDLDLETCANRARETNDFGGRAWHEDEIDQLCRLAPGSKEPAVCFDTIMTDGLNWGGGTQWAPANALALCAGSVDKAEQISCFAEKIDGGTEWPQAIDACKVR